MNSKHLYCWQMMCLCQWFAPIRNEYQTLGSRSYLNILDLPVWMKHLAPTEAAIFCIDCPILHQVQHDFRTRLSESTFLVQNNGLFTFYTGKAILSYVWKHCFLHTYIIVSAVVQRLFTTRCDLCDYRIIFSVDEELWFKNSAKQIINVSLCMAWTRHGHIFKVLTFINHRYL